MRQTQSAPALGRFTALHLLLSVQTLVVILGSINRLGSFTLSYVAPNQFLRWVDLINMLPLPIISVLTFYLLKKHLEQQGDPNTRRAALLTLNLAFLIGVYLLAASYGDHEVTNYLHGRFCETDTHSDLCRIIIYNDDEFGHYLFFTGFVIINTVIMLMQVLFPYAHTVRAIDNALILFNALFRLYRVKRENVIPTSSEEESMLCQRAKMRR